MGQKVQVNTNHTSLPDGGHYYTGNQVTLTAAQYAQLASNVFSSGTLTDLGPTPDDTDQVVKTSAAVADVGAVTSAVAVAAPTKAEFDALRVDALAVRTTLNLLLASLRGVGEVLG